MGSRDVASSPRPWGCFRLTSYLTLTCAVFPTPVGVFLAGSAGPGLTVSLPHARGGVSRIPHACPFLSRSSPRPWGCFRYPAKCLCLPSVFPTPVGVFLRRAEIEAELTGLPHARGGVSYTRCDGCGEYVSSPRPWGCFQRQVFCRASQGVFPTPVGVFLKAAGKVKHGNRLPHARGGVSNSKPHAMPPPQSSPRPWGCFYFSLFSALYRAVFPTPVGVFLPCWF